MKTVFVRELPEEERPREKLIRRGAGTLSNAELLAILIRTGTTDASAIDLAERVLALCPEGIGRLASLVPEELEDVPGIGPVKACQITAALELGRRIATSPKAKRIPIFSPDGLAALFMEEMRHLPQEEFRVLLLNARLEVIAKERVSVGDLTSTTANPREVFREAVRRNASQIVLVHNHPSGDPQPSEQDIRTTRRLAETGRVLGIPLVDHIIIGDGIYTSLTEKGIIRKEY